MSRPVGRWIGDPNASSTIAPLAQPIAIAIREVDGNFSAGSDAQCDDDADEEPRDMTPPAPDDGAAHDGEAGSDRDEDLIGEAAPR